MPHKVRRVARPAPRRAQAKRMQPKKRAELVRIPPASDKPWILNTDEIAIVKNNIAKGATDEELKFLLTVARRYRLDPFRQQIWFVRRWDKNADSGNGAKGCHVWTPQVGINGLLFAAARDHKNELGSIALPEYGPMITVGAGWTKTSAPEWAIVKVFKKGNPEPTVAQAYWSEYAPADLEVAPFWRKMPRRMIAKCATALALREAYPDLGGLYIPEEMAKMNEEYTPAGRLIREVRPEPAQAVAEEKIKAHAEGRLITEDRVAEPIKEIIQVAPWTEGRVSLTGVNGLSIIKAEIEQQELADMGIMHNTKEKITHMPSANVVKFSDRAEKCGVRVEWHKPEPGVA